MQREYEVEFLTPEQDPHHLGRMVIRWVSKRNGLTYEVRLPRAVNPHMWFAMMDKEGGALPGCARSNPEHAFEIMKVWR